eukprot:Phypoly_transcript_07394.p1 GENE.Phypoly_transcript_07394~~Phypoly_transcript_07394.p1  ORF type:complete len:487 (+),score=85.84 Phypoly_transcript_07394:129-1589(+)
MADTSVEPRLSSCSLVPYKPELFQLPTDCLIKIFSLLDTGDLLRTTMVSKGWNAKSPTHWTSLRFYIKPSDAVSARMITRCAESLRYVEVWRFEDDSRASTYRALAQCGRLVHARVGEQGLPFLTRNARLASIAVDSAFLDPEAELVFFSAFASLRHLQKVVLQNTTREGLEIILAHSPQIKVLRLHCLSGTELQALEHARALTSLSLLYFKEAFMPGLARALTGVASTLTSLDLEYARKKEGLGLHHLLRFTQLTHLAIHCGVNFNVQAHVKTELGHLAHFRRLRVFKFHCDIMDGDVYNHIRSASIDTLIVKSNYFYGFFPLNSQTLPDVWSRLTTLHLVKVVCTGAMCNALARAAGALMHVKIQECKNVVSDLYKCIANFQRLKRLDIGFVHVLDNHDDMMGIIATSPNLEHVTITECHDISWIGIARFLKCASLKRLEINFLQESRKKESQQEIYSIFKNKPHLCVVVNSKWGELKKVPQNL